MYICKNNKGEQNYHHTEICFDIDVCDVFIVGSYVAFLFNLEELVIKWKATLSKIINRLEELKIYLGE